MKRLIAAVVVLGLVGGGLWYYFNEFYSTPIGSIVDNPRDYSGKQIAVSGTVTERFSLFVIKYFSLRDETGSIVVVTERPLPAVGARVRVTGRVEDGFSLGDRQTVVFLERGR